MARCGCFVRLFSYAVRADVIRVSRDTAVSYMAYPLYLIEHGKRAGVHQFIYVTAEEYEKLGLEKAKEVEYGRIRAKRISANPEARRKLSERRKHRRNTEPGLRDHELELRVDAN